MHDGQMLFDSTTTWNHTAWDVDDVAGKLMKAKQIRDVIVVGVWNSGMTRYTDYFPKKALNYLPKTNLDSLMNSKWQNGAPMFGTGIQSDDYLKFLVTELKPFIDKTFSTYSDRSNTFVAGSSMGGLISMYAICEYPDVFGGAACLSTHWPGSFTMENNPIPDGFLKYLRARLPDASTHKIYFDCGDQTLDAMYPPLQKKVDDVMKAKGFSDRNWMTKYFPGDAHTESAWKKRLDVPLIFLLAK
jgi:enterochelin esterase-like enzyme